MNEALEVARRGARIACEIMIRHYRSDYSVYEKEGAADRAGAVLTEPDLLCDEAMQSHFGEHFPDHSVVSEESVDKLPERWHENEWIWYIDPIDGSLSFLEGTDSFGVSIALTRNGKPILGVLRNPALELEAWAVAGGGAFLNGSPVVVAAQPHNPARLILGASQSMRYSYGLAVERLKPQEILTIPSVVTKAIRMLQGAGEYYFSLPHKVFGGGCPGAWDLAAAAAILAEAGFSTSDIYGEPMLIRGPETRWRKGHLFAHPDVVDSVRPTLLNLVEERRAAGMEWGPA